MRPLRVPKTTVTDVLDQCVPRIRSKPRRDRIKASSAAIEAAEKAYRAAAQSGDLASYPSSANVGKATKKDMVWLYENRFAAAGALGRPIYDAIRASSPLGVCPLCGHRQVASLDHFLAKASFPALAVTPGNLIPACSDCNHQKADAAPATAEEVLIHPYFDDIDGHEWLVAEVLHTAPASIQFSVSATTSWPGVLKGRVIHHFDELGLAALYASQAAVELTNIHHSLSRMLDADGPTAVTEWLADAAKSRRVAHLNSWQAAMYRALAESEWFCDGGFR